jgi:hypothetical protein
LVLGKRADAGSPSAPSVIASSAVGLQLGTNRHVGVVRVVDDHEVELELAAWFGLDPLRADQGGGEYVRHRS